VVKKLSLLRAAASCDGGYGEKNVGFFLVGGLNVYYYVVYRRTVYDPLAHRYEQVKEPTRLISERNRPTEEGLQSVTVSRAGVTLARQDGIIMIIC